MKTLIPLLALAATPLWAEQTAYPDAHVNAWNCTENLGGSTTWGQCLNLIFAGCATDEVGSEAHLACLDETRKAWSATVENLQEEVNAAITAEGAVELAKLRGQWTGYVIQKCQSVAEDKPQAGQEAARLGCSITEMVGFSAELAACRDGRSAASYCSRP